MGCKQVSDKNEIVDKNKAVAVAAVKENQNEVNKEEVSSKVQGNAIADIKKMDDQMKISIKLGAKSSWEKTVNPKSKVKEVIEEFKSDKVNELPVDNDLIWYINGQPLNVDDEIGTIIPKDSNERENIDITVDVLGLPNFVSNPSKAISREIDLIGKPLAEPFEVYVFSRQTKHFHVDRYENTNNSITEISNFSNLSAYCNGDNHLYISGGEKEGIILGHFWTINLRTKEIEKNTSGIMPKKQHSMIYVPNRHVFMVGGNDLRTLYYDTDEKAFCNWADLNEIRIEPALAIINHKYLYAFSNLKTTQNSVITFEKTNLRTIPKWELIYPNLSSPELEFDQKFFGVCDLSENLIIFIGGNMNEKDNQKMSFEYDTDTNIIKESLTPFQEFDFAEKTFMPFNEKYSFLIPHLNRNESKLVILNKKEYKTQSVHFSQITTVTTTTTTTFKQPNMRLHYNATIEQGNNVSNTTVGQKKRFNFNMPKSEPVSETINNNLKPDDDYTDDNEHRRELNIPKNYIEQKPADPEEEVNAVKAMKLRKGPRADYRPNDNDDDCNVELTGTIEPHDAKIRKGYTKEFLGEEEEAEGRHQIIASIIPELDEDERRKDHSDNDHDQASLSDHIHDDPTRVKAHAPIKDEKVEGIQIKDEDDKPESSQKKSNILNGGNIGQEYIANENEDPQPNQRRPNPIKNFGGSLIRSSVIENVRKSAIPTVKKANKNQFSGSIVRISGDFKEGNNDDLKSSKLAAIAGKKIAISEMKLI